MTLARTEHGLAVINGIPTVVGGVAEDEFLASVEQLDSSNDQDIAYQRQWRLVAQVRQHGLVFLPADITHSQYYFQALSVPRYDFGVAQIPTSKVNRDLLCKAP